jgi:uncharacterized protein involved in exopolysaccharide biosynthesis
MSRIDDALRRIAQLRRAGGPGPGSSHEVARFPSITAVTLDAYRGEGAAAAVVQPSHPVQAAPKPVRLAQQPVQPLPAPAAQTAAEQPVDDGALIDVGQITDYVRFVLGSLRRHKLITAATFLFVAGLSFGAAVLWPKTYQADARLIIQRNDVMAALSNPGRTIPRDGDAPTRGAGEIILSRESLASLVKQTNLLAQWQQRRAPVLRLKDGLMNRMRGVPTDAERLEGMIGLLEQRLTVSPGIDGTLTIAVTWPDRQMAYEIVETAVQNFFDNKRVGESSAIIESVGILERYVASKQSEVNATFAELQTEIANRPRPSIRRPAPAPAKPATPLSSVPAAPQTPTTSSFGIVAPEKAARLARIKYAIEARRVDIARLDQAKATQLNELQGRLAAALTVYTEDHPTVSSLRQNIATLSSDSAQLMSLRAEVQGLEREQDQLLAETEPPPAPSSAAVGSAPPSPSPAAAPTRPADAVPVAATPDLSALGVGSDYTSPTSLRFRLELGQLAEIRERLESARIELATSQAGFKYRYGIVRPTQMPRGPVKPNMPMILIAGLIAGLGLAVFAAVAIDLIRGRVVEPWQVDRLVGVPVVLRLRTL